MGPLQKSLFMVAADHLLHMLSKYQRLETRQLLHMEKDTYWLAGFMHSA